MAINAQYTEFRHPETAAYLQGLTDKAAFSDCPRERRRCRYFLPRGRGGRGTRRADLGVEALLAAAESEFGGLLPRLKSEFGGGGVPNLNAFETLIREG